MATVTGLTKARMLLIEEGSIIDARLDNGELILTTRGGTDINVGSVKGDPRTLIDLGVTATAEELNFVDGVTSAIQTQLNGKAASSHTHDDRYYTETEVTALLAGKANASHTHTLSQITDVTATAAEVNKLDGVTATTAELNILDGVTATAEELNFVDGVTSAIQTQLNGKAASSHTHDDRYYTETEVTALLAGKANASHTHTLSQITDVTATAAEVNKLDGVTATTAELNYVDGVTSNIQTQLNARVTKKTTETSGTISTTPAGTIYWYRYDDGYVEIFWTSSGNVTNDTQYTIGTLPAGARPTREVPCSVSGGVYGDRPGAGTVWPDGTVKIRNTYSSALAMKAYALFKAYP